MLTARTFLSVSIWSNIDERISFNRINLAFRDAVSSEEFSAMASINISFCRRSSIDVCTADFSLLRPKFYLGIEKFLQECDKRAFFKDERARARDELARGQLNRAR